MRCLALTMSLNCKKLTKKLLNQWKLSKLISNGNILEKNESVEIKSFDSHFS